jgi:hypothetical protein
MGAPITWQNVGAANPGSAAPIIQGAVQTTNGAFDIFSKLLQQSQANDQANFAAGNDANKQAYLDKLNTAKTPEEIAALHASGQLDAMRQGLTATARGETRGADEARTTAVQQHILTTNKFNDDTRLNTEQPFFDKAKAMIIAKDPGAMDYVASAPIRDKSALMDLLHTTSRRSLEEGQQDALRPLTLEAAKRTDKIGALDLTEKQRALTESERQRQLDLTATDFISNHQGTAQAIRQGIDSGIANFPGVAQLPRNSDGQVAFERLPTPITKALNEHLNKQGLPTIDALGGDTAALTNARAKLVAAGARPADMQRLEPYLAGALNTASPAPIGREAETAQRTLRGLQAEEGAVNDQFGTVSAQGNKADLLKSVTDTVDSLRTGVLGSKERYTRGVAKWLDGGGIPVLDPKGNPTGERVLPSPAQLNLVINKLNTGNLWNRESDIPDLINEWAKSAEAQEGARKVIAIRDRNRLLGIDPLGKK